MLTHEIPTHLNARDTLLWGRTVPELLILLGGLVSLWLTLTGLGPHVLPPNVMICWTVFSTGALVIWQPYDRRLDAWAVLYVRYLLQPRRMIYRPVGGVSL